MSAAVALSAMALLYFLGYRLYSRRLATVLFGLSDEERTPAHDPSLQDGVDYVPAPLNLLWGHHYTSIAGAAPIIGPAVAVIWGWGPALAWIVLGSILIGATHDFGALVVSARNGGHSVGDLAGRLLVPRVRVLFQIVVYFLIWIVLAVFAVAIAVLFVHYPATVLPINFEILVAVVLGWLFYKRGVGLLWPSVAALVLMYATVGLGLRYPITLDGLVGAENAVTAWALFLLAYSAVASILPVWVLLQPRDYINSHQLIVGLGGLVLGLVVLHPPLQAPLVRLDPPGAPPILPVLFVTVACGAISGFHGLVSSGTTSKQLDRMPDARAIGYGGMLGEACLAVVATMAVAAGLPDWHVHYAEWNASGGKAIANFVHGGANFLAALGLPTEWGQALVAVLAISFAATSMDTAARIQRMVVAELGAALRVPLLKNHVAATVLAVGPAVPLVLLGQEAWAPLWLLFGTTNQMIGGLTMLVVFAWLFQKRRSLAAYGLPMAFLLIMTTSALVYNLFHWVGGAEGATGLTVALGASLLVLEVWIVVETALVLLRLRDRGAPPPAPS